MMNVCLIVCLQSEQTSNSFQDGATHFKLEVDHVITTPTDKQLVVWTLGSKWQNVL
jgi:hypothetical protein